MTARREHLQLHLELVQQAFGREQILAVTARATAKAAPPRSTAATPERAAAVARTPTQPTTPSRQRAAPPAPTSAPTSARATPAAADLATLREEALACTKCQLSAGRNTVVFGEGDPAARVMFIGEAPGVQEDRTGRPFVGPAGSLLDAILTRAMGLQRSEVYIANINKCRPPNNRDPQPDEVASCLPFLRRQVALIQPEVIVCLGRIAAQNLLARKESASRLRGLELSYEGIPVVVTWHPAYLLREPGRKRETWEDIKRVNRLLGRPEVPPPAPPAAT